MLKIKKKVYSFYATFISIIILTQMFNIVNANSNTLIINPEQFHIQTHAVAHSISGPVPPILINAELDPSLDYSVNVTVEEYVKNELIYDELWGREIYMQDELETHLLITFVPCFRKELNFLSISANNKVYNAYGHTSYVRENHAVKFITDFHLLKFSLLEEPLKISLDEDFIIGAYMFAAKTDESLADLQNINQTDLFKNANYAMIVKANISILEE